MDAHLARLDQRVEDLERWQSRQNGQIDRIEERVLGIERQMGRIAWSTVGILAGIVVNLLLTLLRG